MIIYLLKMTICESLLIVVYYFLLEKERMHQFKRFYLLFSLVFSLAIPFLSTQVSGTSLIGHLPFTIKQTPDTGVVSLGEGIQQEAVRAFSFFDILSTVYIAVAIILLFRFIFNIAYLLKLTRENEQINIDNIKIILTGKKLIPYSFAHYIFLNRDEYKEGLIESEVLTHEIAHIRQHHSIDIIFLELLLVLFWFNPILYIYKNRIKLNHEFLADEAVICAYNNTPQYQKILIDKISRQSSLSITSSFNYLLTKKRLTMMTKMTSTRTAISRKIMLLPLFLLFTFTFCTKKVSDEQPKITEDKELATKEEEKVDVTKDSVKVTGSPTGDKQDKQKKTVKFAPPTVVKDKDGQVPPPPPLLSKKKLDKDSKSELDLSGYKVGDKYIDSDGHEWEVVSVNPPKLKTPIKR